MSTASKRGRSSSLVIRPIPAPQSKAREVLVLAFGHYKNILASMSNSYQIAFLTVTNMRLEKNATNWNSFYSKTT